MGGIGFVVAMRVVNAIADDDRPHQGDPPVAWLIVCRWGARGERLTISKAVQSFAHPPAKVAGSAPDGLAPKVTWFGEMAPASEPGEPVFLLARSLPPSVPLAGEFEPAEGFARLGSTADGWPRLSVIARLSEPGTDAMPARIWQLVAERRAWIGECLDALPDPGG